MNENIRLLLQYLKDNSCSGGTPMMLPEGTEDRAVEMGFMETAINWLNDERTIGLREYTVTTIGTEALNAANKELGDKAVRYVRKVKYFGSLEPIVYGWPFQQPLSAPVRYINGSVVADERSYLGGFN